MNYSQNVYYDGFDTTFCEIICVGNAHGIQQIRLVTNQGDYGRVEIPPLWVRKKGAFREAATQLFEYFHGSRKTFSLKLNPQGTSFQNSVWCAMGGISYGSLATYGQLASILNRGTASRAVGGACNKNPILIAIPCHRVIGARGDIKGFGHGIDMKRRLIDLEEHYAKH